MTDTVPLRDLRIAENKNVQYRKQLSQLRDLLSQANTKNEILRHAVKRASKVGETHVKHAGLQLDILHSQFSKCRKIIDRFINGLNDTTKATEEFIVREYVEKTMEKLIKAIGHEAKGE